MINKLPKVQIIAIVATVVYFALINKGLAAIYGGLVSLSNTWIVNRYINKQAKVSIATPQAIVTTMTINVIIRMFFVAVFILIGLLKLKLAPEALIIGFTLGQIGFLIDRIRK